MTVSRRAILAGLAPAGAALTSPLHAEGIIDDLIGAKDDFVAASEAYIYGYPLITMEMTRRVMTNVASVEPTGPAARAGIKQGDVIVKVANQAVTFQAGLPLGMVVPDHMMIPDEIKTWF